MRLNVLYDSDAFIVVQVDENIVEGQPDPADIHIGFEIVDKRKNKGIYLYGAMAQRFVSKIKQWQADTPDQSAVEACLDGYSQVMNAPLVQH